MDQLKCFLFVFYLFFFYVVVCFPLYSGVKCSLFCARVFATITIQVCLRCYSPECSARYTKYSIFLISYDVVTAFILFFEIFLLLFFDPVYRVWSQVIVISVFMF